MKKKPARPRRARPSRRRPRAPVATAVRASVPPAAAVPAAAVEERGLPIVRELHRIVEGSAPPALKIEGALEVLFGALGEADADFSGLVLGGWIRAREDKQFRLTMAWLREQMRLSVEEILVEGIAAGAFRADLRPEAVAAAFLGAAEGCLLQTASHGGTVPPAVILRALVRLVTPP